MIDTALEGLEKQIKVLVKHDLNRLKTTIKSIVSLEVYSKLQELENLQQSLNTEVEEV